MRIISGTARGTVLKTPDGMLTRPTADRVKEAMFSILQFELPGANVLDLFGGTGQLGLEALSRGAKSATFVDSRNDACRLIKENIRRCKFEDRTAVICADYMQFLKKCAETYRIVLLDPPYAEDFLENSLKLLAEIDILQSGGIIIAERPAGKELSLDIEGLIRSRDYKYGNTLLTLFRKA